jgi:hypothetical protein
VRHSIGARLSRLVAELKPGWDFDYEGLWQFGTFGSANISAWTVASETGYRFPNVPLKPRFSVKADVSSGDDPRTTTLGTFNPLFPKGNYFGVLAAAGPGPINFIDIHPRAEATLPQGGNGIHPVSQTFPPLKDPMRTSIYGFKPTTTFFMQADLSKKVSQAVT